MKALKKMEALQQKEPSRIWGDVMFIGEATEEVILCRTVLKWTYVLAYSLDDASPTKELFLYLQQDLESNTEKLSELLEKDVESLLQPDMKQKILSLVSCASKSRQVLLKGVNEFEGAIVALQ